MPSDRPDRSGPALRTLDGLRDPSPRPPPRLVLPSRGPTRDSRHGIGASVSGMLRTAQGTYAQAWLVTAVLCLAAGVVSMTMPRRLVTGRAAPA